MSTTRDQVLALLRQMRPIDLSEMSGIRLMNRIDTKYIATERGLVKMLEMAKGDYRVQEIDGKRTGLYDTIYFDTEGADMYLMHHNQKLGRQKIRTRTYVDSNLAFLEIKNKDNRGRTKKERTQIELGDFGDFGGNQAARDFVFNESNYSLRALSPHVRTSFERITLVNERKTERLTIDMGLTFENMRGGRHMALPGVVIVELKQDGLAHSEMKEILLDLRIHERRVSKYCMGTVFTDPDAKINGFKETARYMEKLMTK